MTNKLSLADKAFFAIKEDIIENRLTPGEKLVISELSERYQVGSSPLREALSRLAATGILDLQSMKGYRVPPLCEQELMDVYNARTLVEREMLRQVIEHVTDEQESQIVAAHHQLKKLELSQLDNETFSEWQRRHRIFVDALMAPCPSPTLHRIEGHLYDQGERYRRIWFTHFCQQQKSGLRHFIMPHQAFVDAVIARDADGLDRAYTEKMATWIKQAISCLQEQGND